MTVRLKKDVPSLIILKISKSMKMQKFPDFLGILFLASGIAEFMEKGYWTLWTSLYVAFSSCNSSPNVVFGGFHTWELRGQRK